MSSIPLYALADPHLGADMTEYGWGDHSQRLFANWDRTVPNDALVLVPGDISDAKTAGEVAEHFGLLHQRTGQLKILSPGNHDTKAAWRTQGKALSLCAPYPSLTAIRSSVRRFTADDDWPGMVLVGLNGSITPGSAYYASHERHANGYAKHTAKLKLLLAEAHTLRQPGDKLVVAIHHPPFKHYAKPSKYTTLMEGAGVELCVFGHLHNPREHQMVFQGERGGVRYRLVAADYLHFSPRLLGEFTPTGLKIFGHGRLPHGSASPRELALT